MVTSEISRMPRPQEVARMSTAVLREVFLVSSIHQRGALRGLFTDLDRMVVADAVSAGVPIELPNAKKSAVGSFSNAASLERSTLAAPEQSR